MNFSNAPADFLVNIGAGLVVALIILFVIDRRRRPRLTMKIERPPNLNDGRIFLRVFVENAPMSRPFRFMNRESADATRALISFYHYPDTTPVYSAQMVGRWSETPAPRSNSESRDWENIPPEEGRNVDICVKQGQEIDCYGWNNQNYEVPNQWKFGRGRYFVKVCVKTGGQKYVEVFQLLNDDDFRLDEANIPELKKQYEKLKHWGI